MARNPDKKLRERLAAHLRQVMEQRGWSQADLGRALGSLGTGFVSRLLSAERTMGLDIFARLHIKLGLDANMLLDEDPPAHFFKPELAPSRMAGELEDIARSGKVPTEVVRRLERLAGTLRAKPRRGLAAK